MEKINKNELNNVAAGISKDELGNPIPNATDALQGKVAGINITSGGGTPGGGAEIRVNEKY